MNSISEQIGDFLNSGDPEIRTWFLIRQNYLPFILCGCYVIFSTRMGPALMRNRKPFELRTIMIVFNIFLVFTYIGALFTGFWYLPNLPYEAFCKGGIVRKGEVTYTLASVCWGIYILKYIEFLDTVIFVLRKKDSQITFLHVLHHTLVPIVGWIGFRTETSGFQTIPGIINCIVHIIMYTYYGLAAIGPSVRKYLWWKKYLTQLQMIQFFLIFLLVTVAGPLSGCKMTVSASFFGITLAPVFLYLFYKYYMSNFSAKRE